MFQICTIEFQYSMVSHPHVVACTVFCCKMNFNSLFVKTIRIRSELINYQTQRWRRPKKPFWLGVAKSKMFRIPTPRITWTDEEKKQNANLNNHYKTELKSILNFIQEENPRLQILNQDGVTESPELLEKMAESLKINDRWNAESARLRDIRMTKTAEVKMEAAMEKIAVIEEKKSQELEIIENIVRMEKENSLKFVTPENLDEKVEECLNNIKNFDFAIDLDGNRYPGRETLRPPVVKESESESESEEVASQNV